MMWKGIQLLYVLPLAILLLSSTSCAKGQETTTNASNNTNENDSSVASVVGFAVVVSILILAVAVVVMMCLGYGLCKTPCKKEPIGGRRSERQLRSMIPLPSPRTVQPTTASSNPLREQHTQAFTSSSTGQLRMNSTSMGRNGTGGPLSPEVLSAPPISTNAVVHLSQLQSLSFHSGLHHALDTAIEQGVISTSPPQNDTGPPTLLPAPPPGQPRGTGFRTSSAGNQTHAAVSNGPPTHIKPRMIRPPPPYPGIGYPYQPCKTPAKNSHVQGVLQALQEFPPPAGASGLYARRHAKNSKPKNVERDRQNDRIVETVEHDSEQDIEFGDCSVQNLSHTDRSSPPSYCTEV